MRPWPLTSDRTRAADSRRIAAPPPSSGGRILGELRRVATDLVPAGLVGDLEVETWIEIEVAHQAGRDEVLAAEVVVDARPAVAAEVAGREFALVRLHQVLALGELEVLVGHDHSGEARARPPLATGAVTVPQGFRILDLVLH